MDLKTLAHGAPWMTPEETEVTQRFVRGMKRLFKRHGVKETPLLALRVDDVIVSYLLVCRIEAGLEHRTAGEPEGSAKGTGRASNSLVSLVDAAGKARERMRKAMKELEDLCGSGETANGGLGLADLLKPLMTKTDGVIELALTGADGEDARAAAQGEIIPEAPSSQA